jgi:hypothetical protein
MPREHPLDLPDHAVRGLLRGDKTTHRLLARLGSVGHIWPLPEGRFKVEYTVAGRGAGFGTIESPCGVPGDHVWVRERWAPVLSDLTPGVRYLAGDPWEANPEREGLTWVSGPDAPALVELAMKHCGKARPAYQMKRWMSRIVLEVTGVRLERLHALDNEAARAEGIPQTYDEAVRAGLLPPRSLGSKAYWRDRDAWNNRTSRENFAAVWDHVHAHTTNAWERNPRVWVLAFRVLIPAQARRYAADRERCTPRPACGES